MRVPFRLVSAAPLLLIGPSIAASPVATAGTTVSLEVPVICRVVHRGVVAQQGDAYSLGQLFEYCNAPRGFLVQVAYEPGSLRGTIVQAGDARVVLDGSGESAIIRGSGPKISTVDVSATPGPQGFNPAALQFQIVPL